VKQLNKHSYGRILKANLNLEFNSSEILLVNCRFIRCSTPT